MGLDLRLPMALGSLGILVLVAAHFVKCIREGIRESRELDERIAARQRKADEETEAVKLFWWATALTVCLW